MPTAARQKYLAKQAAKKADILSDIDRQAEYDKVMGQLTQISSPEVDKFEALMSEWVKDAKVRQGVIPIPSIRRALCYSLGISRSKTFVSLRSDELDHVNSTPQQSSQTENQVPANPVENGDPNQDEEQMPELVPTTKVDNELPPPQSGTADITSVLAPFEEPLRQMTQDILDGIGNTLIDEHFEKLQHAYQELNKEDDKLTGSLTSKTNKDTVNKKSNEKKKKKQQVFSQSAPRGSRHASRPPPAMKPKAQSA